MTDIRDRIRDFARDLLDINPDLSTNFWSIAFGNEATDEGGELWPRSATEWETLRRDTRFDHYFADHAAERVDGSLYADPVQGVTVAVGAALADLICWEIDNIVNGDPAGIAQGAH